MCVCVCVCTVTNCYIEQDFIFAFSPKMVCKVRHCLMETY